jgi:HEAT repeat protein
VVTLAYLREAPALAALRASTRDPDARVRRLAIGALASVGGVERGSELLADVLAALRDDDWQVRAEAAIVAGRTGLGSAAPALIAALDDELWQVRKEAALALGKLDVPAAAPSLTALLADGNPDLRKAAAVSLGALGARDAVGALRSLAGDADVEVRKAGARALVAIEERGSGKSRAQASQRAID